MHDVTLTAESSQARGIAILAVLSGIVTGLLGPLLALAIVGRRSEVARSGLVVVVNWQLGILAATAVAIPILDGISDRGPALWSIMVLGITRGTALIFAAVAIARGQTLSSGLFRFVS
jgi:hypothetical protein